MGNIRLIDRMWRRFHFTDAANLAEHHYRVFWIAMILAKHESSEVDTGKVAKLALLHDIPESRAGDVDYISRQYVERSEDMAIQDILEDTAIKEEFLALWEEYETRESLESKIVKDADTLDVDFELAEQEARGSTVKLNKAETRKRASEKLYTDTAKKIYEQLQESNPHDWWRTSSRNRLNAGDWKK